MDITLKSTIILSKDMNRAVYFYKDIIGLELQKQYETVAFFQDGLVIHDEATYLSYINESKNNAAQPGTVFYYVVSDIDKMFNALLKKNVRLIHGIQTQEWEEKCIRLYDPDGNYVEIGDGKNSSQETQ